MGLHKTEKWRWNKQDYLIIEKGNQLTGNHKQPIDIDFNQTIFNINPII